MILNNKNVKNYKFIINIHCLYNKYKIFNKIFLMESEKKWFYLSSALTAMMGGYVLYDLYIKNKKLKRKNIE